ncbi:NAD(P)-dependent alcohol dehydrogenase [Saccharopolyspora sp. 6V]|uniref:NAD(P)-dependent alcohol dehydrogenase n=1 Tax=Saccharopolyspora sp. 6V TaxID=2877239 RepID=UPI0027DFFE89|nr:NAD(P)-dependent alcohol dehydrogenase [Saccharopolyspora sp. 6V]
MGSMKAVQYRKVGSRPEVVEIPVPEPGPGQVLLRVEAAGVCHSDFTVMSWPAEGFPYPLPLTLGHEGAGTVAAVGRGVTAVAEGEQVAVYGPWGCGGCRQCATGMENYCTRTAELGVVAPGLAAPGAMAEYMVVDDPRHLAPLDGLDPVVAAPLTDAGLTPYHAISRSLPKLVAGSTAVVIGVGGLGHLGVQLLRALTPARIVAIDLAEEPLELARRVGAHEVLRSDEHAARRVRELTGGRGAELVVDFVGAEPTVRTAAECVGIAGDVTLVGVGEGRLPVAFGAVPFGVSVAAPCWGGRAELLDVLALGRSGAISVHTETFPLEQAPEVYERLHHGDITGRAVLVP